MSEQAAEAMNSLTVYELRTMYVSCGLISVLGNGQLTKVTTEDDSAAEQERCEHGY